MAKARSEAGEEVKESTVGSGMGPRGLFRAQSELDKENVEPTDNITSSIDENSNLQHVSKSIKRTDSVFTKPFKKKPKFATEC